MTLKPFDRRSFLKQSALAATILGFSWRDGFAAAPRLGKLPAEVDYLELARQRMKDEVKMAVVLVIPDEPNAAQVLANELAQLLGSHDPTCALEQPGRF